MADEKKNPLIGAFRTPEPPKIPLDPKPAQPPGITPPAPNKAEEVKKTEEQGKPATDPKATPTNSAAAPPKTEETKKTEEQGKAVADPKSAPANGAADSAKPSEVKKPEEQGKPSADPKATPSTSTTAPDKTEERKKTAEPPKTPGDEKAPADITPPAEDDLPKNLHIPLTKPDQPESVVTLPLTDIHVFEGHPFNVNDDKDMWDLVESVKQFGLLEPAVVIPREKGGYEMVSGHRRQRACQLAGLSSMPVIVRNLDRDEAIINMVDAVRP